MEGIAYEYRSAQPDHTHVYLRPFFDEWLKDLPPGSSILDLGCGNGSFLSQFQDRGWQLHGTDFSPTGIAVAQQSFPSIHFFLADAQQAGEISQFGPFDVVLSTEVIEHLYDPRSFVRNLFAQLKPGGQCILSTPYHGYLKNLSLALTGKLDQHFTVLWDHGHIKFFSRETLSTVLREAGFVDLEFRGAGRVPFLWKSMLIRCRRPAEV